MASAAAVGSNSIPEPTVKGKIRRRDSGRFGRAEHRIGRHVLGFFVEHQAVRASVEIDADQVAAPNLLGRHEIGERMHQRAIDSALEVAGAVFDVGTFAQQKFLSRFGEHEEERRCGG